MKSGVQRIAQAFQQAADEDRAALITFLAAGDPGREAAESMAIAAAEAGADVLELGVPFSDPLADGPVIQAAYTRALDSGFQVADVLSGVRRISGATSKPVVLMTALNPILACGIEAFFCEAAQAGVAGILIPDLPVEDADGARAAARRHGLATVFLAAPDSPPSRLAAVAEASTGFLYLISRRGVTGTDQSPGPGIQEQVARARGHSRVPVAVGFGVANGQDAARVAVAADGVIAGSALVAAAAAAHEGAIQAGRDTAAADAEAAAAVASLVKELRTGCLRPAPNHTRSWKESDSC